MADKKISQLTAASQVNSDAVFPLSQLVSGEDATLKATVGQVGNYIADEQTHAGLNTSAKDLIGAINEIAAGGGGGNIPFISLINNGAIATSGTARHKGSIDANNYISVVGNTVTLYRTVNTYWISFYTGVLEAGKNYAFIFDSVTNTDNNIYIATVADISGITYSVTRIRTEALANGTRGWVFSPPISGVYDFLIGASNNDPIVCVNPRIADVDYNSI